MRSLREIKQLLYLGGAHFEVLLALFIEVVGMKEATNVCFIFVLNII